jgi:hypothetical protein
VQRTRNWDIFKNNMGLIIWINWQKEVKIIAPEVEFVE